MGNSTLDFALSLPLLLLSLSYNPVGTLIIGDEETEESRGGLQSVTTGQAVL